MTRDEIIGLSFLNNGIAEQEIDAKLGDTFKPVNVGSVKKDTKVSIKNNRVAVDINLTLSYEFYKSYSEKEKKIITAKATEHIYSICNKTITKALKEEKADIFEIHSLLNHNDYTLYEEYKKNPDAILERVDINIKIDPQN